LRRWVEVMNNPELSEIEGRIETDRHGHLIIKEKMALFFNAGASEVWVCAQTGAIQFFDKNLAPLGKSTLCPRFPKRIKLR
jgi:hypothetical protein